MSENGNKNIEEEIKQFKREQKELLEKVVSNRIYKLNRDTYIQITGGVNYENQLKIIDQYVQIFQNKDIADMLFQNKFYSTGGIYFGPNSSIGVISPGEWELNNLSGEMYFENDSQSCSIYFKNDKPVKVNLNKNL